LAFAAGGNEQVVTQAAASEPSFQGVTKIDRSG